MLAGPSSSRSMHEGDDRECHLCADACAPGRAFTGACAGCQERGQVARLYAHQENAAAAVAERRGASRASGCWPGVRRGRAECMQVPAWARACARLRPRRGARPCEQATGACPGVGQAGEQMLLTQTNAHCPSAGAGEPCPVSLCCRRRWSSSSACGAEHCCRGAPARPPVQLLRGPGRQVAV